MTRSELMSRIRSKGNASTELKYMKLLRRHHVTGWRRHLKVLGIRPDFVFSKARIAVFIDGCFWHACPFHCNFLRLPLYWQRKVAGNCSRDVKQEDKLTDAGWVVKRVWEHELRGIK